MTAPDPGSTDLIAPHRLWFTSRDGAGCYGCDWRSDVPPSEGLENLHTAHVALLVEQHANGREAVDFGADAQDYEIAWAAKLRWQARAEQAETKIARVEKLAHDMRGWCSPHGISVAYSDRIVAALEGEHGEPRN